MLLQIVKQRLEQGAAISVGAVSIGSASANIAVVEPHKAGDSLPSKALELLGVGEDSSVFLALGSGLQGEPSGWVGAGDALALSMLQAAFAASKDTRVGVGIVRSQYSNMAALLREHPQIVSIGGPMSNAITSYIMSTYPLAFSFDRLSILDGETKHVHKSTLRKQEPTGRDWGLLLRLRNPFSSDGWILVLAGIHGFGTQAAAQLLLQMNDQAQDLDAPFPSGAFEALLSVEVKDGQIVEMHLVKVLPVAN